MDGGTWQTTVHGVAKSQPGDLPDPGIEPSSFASRLLHWQAASAHIRQRLTFASSSVHSSAGSSFLFTFCHKGGVIRKNPQVPHTAGQVACHPVNNSRGKRSSGSSLQTEEEAGLP